MKVYFFALLGFIGLGCSPLLAMDVYTFTSGGTTGNVGPDQATMDTAYTGTNLEGNVTVNAGIQEWVVPTTALYRVEAFGGQGWGDFGGRGAHISGEFPLTAGDTIRVLVGQKAGPYLSYPSTTYNHQFGGGGGSFVMLVDPMDAGNLAADTPLVIAGGGGGNHGLDWVATADGQTTEAGASGANASIIGAGGTDGMGGQQATAADGGGGLLTDGAGAGAQGQAYVNGGLGGIDEGTGGFGAGGGTSSWNNYRGGGGGGYSGGGGGNNSGSCCPAGGGGGSYNGGANPVNLPGVQLGDGQVVISIVTGPPDLSKAFAPNFVAPGSTTLLTFLLDSSFNVDPATNLAFTDNLPAGLVLATPANASSTCNGTLTADDGASLVSLAGGSIPAGGSCEISVDVYADTVGSYHNVSSVLDSNFGFGTNPAMATLEVSPMPTFSMAFAPSVAAPGDVVGLSLSIDASATTVNVTDIAFTDNLPSGMTIATPANLVSSCGGTATAVEGTTVVELTDGLVPSGGSCEITVNVSTAMPGGYDNVTSPLSSNFQNIEPANATLIVSTAPGFGKTFLPDTTVPGQTVTLTFTIDNSFNAVDATNLLFTDNFPVGMTVATPTNAYNNCGGSLTANEGGAFIALSGGTAMAGGSCSVSVDVATAQSGVYNNISGNLTSNLGNSGNASDSLSVVNATSRTVTDTGDDGDGVCDASCTLRDAVAASFSGDTVDFSPLLPQPVVVELTGPPITVDVSMAIEANAGVRTAVRRAGGSGRLLEVLSNGNLRVTGVDFEQGTEAPTALGAGAMGGAIHTSSGSTLEIIDGTFRENSASGSGAGTAGVPGGSAAGGAIYADGDLLLRNCAFVENVASGGSGRSGGTSTTAGGSANGGAIHANGLLDILNCTFAANQASGGAGGNGANDGMGGPGGNGSNGGAASGGAISASASADMSMAFATLIENHVSAGAGGSGGAGTPPGTDGAAGATSGAAIESGASTLVNTSVVAGNQGGDSCGGAGFSLRSENQVDDISCPGNVSAGLAMEFAPIVYGMDSPNYQPLPNSVVVDTSPDCLDATGMEVVEDDQLGAIRPMTNGGVPACDFGAVELSPELFSDGFEGAMPPP